MVMTNEIRKYYWPETKKIQKTENRRLGLKAEKGLGFVPKKMGNG
jgi:hypothetical protein